MPESWTSHSKLWPPCHHYTTQVFHLTNWCSAFTPLCDAHVVWEHLPCCAFKPPERHAQVSPTGFLTPDWMGTPSLSQSPVYNPRPKWFLHSDPFFIFAQLSVLKCGDPKALSSRGDTEHCRVCSSLKTLLFFILFWWFPDSHGPRFKNSSALGWAFRPRQAPQEAAHTYLQAIIMQVDPVLLCLSLLQELVGLDTALPSLFRLRAGEPHLEDLPIIQHSPKTPGKNPSALLIWCISNKPGALAPINHPLLSVPSLCMWNKGESTWPPPPKPGSAGLAEVCCPLISLWIVKLSCELLCLNQHKKENVDIQ